LSSPDLNKIPELPLDKDGPVFTAPWQAQAFALVVNLQQHGVFSWDEWAEQLGKSIQSARAAGDPDLGNTYYEHWLAALECITSDKGLTNPEMLAERKQKAHEEHQRLHHGHTH
jgi:nitrile hydratase accessory protein